MSTSCIYFKNNEFWENDVVVFLGLKLLVDSKQDKVLWLNNYFNTVIRGYILKVQPVGSTSLRLDNYFNKLYKRKKFINYIKYVVIENNLIDNSTIDYNQINEMLELDGANKIKHGYVEKKYILEFFNKLIGILDVT
ncbi:hypothetical protein [Flavobacterium lacus]|uniref:Uncharacterized protein n=1 Tax=Flavobacterium lacus TaxID=1353778 RepID=A0A328WXT0_9FLAO|nr:hypothetical protein [Flavobacterium lacus]RAR48078.1 hypothetical protein B0I10_10679 [Flavobacterium lacus]